MQKSNAKNEECQQIIEFSDSDDENEPRSVVQEEVSLRLQENTNSTARAFKDFLSEPKFI